jgi:hypothetical protein
MSQSHSERLRLLAGEPPLGIRPPSALIEDLAPRLVNPVIWSPLAKEFATFLVCNGRVSVENQMPGDIYQLVYRSTYRSGRIDNTLSALRGIVKSSSRNNAARQITGYLVFDGDTFLQILEGAPADVLETFARIETDERHREAVVIDKRMVEQRDFPTWSMGGALWTSTIPASVSGNEAVTFAKGVASGQSRA